MSTGEETKSFSSIGPLMKIPSETPTTNSSLRQTSKKIKNSKSTVSVQRSTHSAQREPSIYSEGASIDKTQHQDLEISKQCECGPDLYSRVLGPTADETILTGLQTVFDLCSRLRVCGDRNEPEEEPSREQDIPERDDPVPSPSVTTARSQTERNTSSAAFQVKPSVKSTAAQTLPFPEMVSAILQTVGLTPEMVSKVMQTSSIEIPKTSLASVFMQTSNATLISDAIQTSYSDIKSGSIQTSSPDLNSYANQTSHPDIKSYSNQTSDPALKLTAVQTSSSLLPEPEPPKQPSRVSYCRCSKGDEHKCITPPEPPASKCRCCKCSSSSSSSLRRSSKSSTENKRPCICGEKRKDCKCGDSKKKKRPSRSVDDDHPSPIEVKYAITKISRYKDFSTFEVMKSTRNQPRQIPKGIEGVFVLRKKNGGSAGDVEASVDKISQNGSKKDLDSVPRSSSKLKNGNHNGSNGMSNSDKELNSQSKVEA